MMRRCRLLGVMGRRFGDDPRTPACRHGCPHHGRGGTCTWLFVRSADCSPTIGQRGSGGVQVGRPCATAGRPPTNTSSEPGEWIHGWQHWASSISDTFFRKSSLLSSRAAASRAHLRSHSGCNAGAALAHAPTTKGYTIPPQLFRVLLLERLQLLLPVTEVTCEGCHSALDARGRHRAACTLSGRVKKRATPIERVLARVCREAGARVRFDAYLRDMNVDVVASDGRRIEVLAQDLPCCGGAQLAVDITLRCVLTRTGEPHRNAADVDGAVLVNARRDKEAKYPELVASRRCKLIVVGIETGGRWSEEAVDFVRQLSIAKAEEVPSFMRRSVSLSWER